MILSITLPIMAKIHYKLESSKKKEKSLNSVTLIPLLFSQIIVSIFPTQNTSPHHTTPHYITPSSPSSSLFFLTAERTKPYLPYITRHFTPYFVYTVFRPVPLQHYIFPAKAEGLFLVVDEKGKFR